MIFLTSDGKKVDVPDMESLNASDLFQTMMELGNLEDMEISCPGRAEYLEICLKFFALHKRIPWAWDEWEMPIKWGRMKPGLEGKTLSTIHTNPVYHETFGWLYSDKFLLEHDADWFLEMEGVFDWFGCKELNNFGNHIWVIAMYKYGTSLERLDDCQKFREYVERDRQYIMTTELRHSKWYNEDGSDKTEGEREKILEAPSVHSIDPLEKLSIMSNIRPHLLCPMRRERYETLMRHSTDAMPIQSLYAARDKYKL